MTRQPEPVSAHEAAPDEPGRKLPRRPTTIFEDAERIVNGARQADYGPPEDSFKDIGNLWGAYLGVTVTPRQVADLMILLKVARNKHAPKRDNYVDIAGYARCCELARLVPATRPEASP